MISIIIPTLNEEKILERTLRALRKLSSIEYELIVSDGASTDRTVEIARRFADKVVVHDGSHRQTIAEGRNLGASVASGDYLVFIDADVFIPKIDQFFATAISLFEKPANKKGKRLEALTCFLKVLPENITLSDKLFFALTNRILQVMNNVLHTGASTGEFQMYRRQTFEKIGGYNPKLVAGEDGEIFCRASKLGYSRIETGLYVMHTSRRAHKIGWINLIKLWITNFIFIKLFKRSYSSEWKAIR